MAVPAPARHYGFDQDFAGKRPRVLMLSASTGNGHMAAAYALEDEARRQGLEAKTVDTLAFAPKGFRAWYAGGYETLVRRRPELWGHLYRTSDRPLFNYHFQTFLDVVFVNRLRNLFADFHPDWVVCTHSLPQPRLAQLRQRYRFRTAVVVTDLYPHRMWLRGRPDRFFVPGEWSAGILAGRAGWAADRVEVTGIPIHSCFRERIGQEEARHRMGLPAGGRMLLATSGGIGGGPMAEALAALRQTPGLDTVVLVCGRNERAFQRLQEELGGAIAFGPPLVVLKGHVDQSEMAGLMAASDLVLSKPGGLTTSEALAVGRPFAVFEPFLIPGQEERNADFLVETGAGIRVPDAEAIPLLVGDLLVHPSRLAEMSAKAKELGRPAAAQLVVERIRQLTVS